MTKNYIKTLEDFQEEYQTKIQELAAEFREEVVLPLCKRHSLGFIAGNGEFYFYPDGGHHKNTHSDNPYWIVGTIEDAEEQRKRYLIPCLEVLNQEVEQNQYFGYYVDDVTVADIAE